MITIVLDADGHEIARLPGRAPRGAALSMKIGARQGHGVRYVIDASDVRAEAQRRIVARTGSDHLEASLVKQMNALARAGELTDKRAQGVALSDAEEAEAAALRVLADDIKAIRAASNAMESDPPEDFAVDHRWPA